MPDISKETITALEESLNDFFHLHRKGRGVRVFVFMRDDGIWFLIRHGLPMKRESAITDQGESKGVLFRPEIYDILTFLPDCGELQIHTSTVGEKKAYCDLIGTHVLNDRDFFIYNGKTEKFSLEPFVRDWRKSLICTDIEGIESVTPIEVRFLVDAETNHQEIEKQAQMLIAELDSAQNKGDTILENEIREEIDQLSDYLCQVKGLGGRLRKGNDNADSIRRSVQQGIKCVFESLDDDLPDFVKHCRQSISFGFVLKYDSTTKIQ